MSRPRTDAHRCVRSRPQPSVRSRKSPINKFPDMFNTFRWQSPGYTKIKDHLSGLCQWRRPGVGFEVGERGKLLCKFHFVWRLVSPLGAGFHCWNCYATIKTFYNSLWAAFPRPRPSPTNGKMKEPPPWVVPKGCSRKLALSGKGYSPLFPLSRCQLGNIHKPIIRSFLSRISIRWGSRGLSKVHEEKVLDFANRFYDF